VVYQSNVLEHIRRSEALPFVRECYRVLKNGGIIRIATPDLEQICRLYLKKLAEALDGDETSANDYEWMMLELYDQAVREQRGGEMLAYLRRDPIPNEAFVYARIGDEGRKLVHDLRHLQSSPKTIKVILQQQTLHSRKYLLRYFRILYEKMMQAILCHAGLRPMKIGRYRLSGEVHQWMYDRYSLAQLLLKAGFQNPTIQRADQSQIPNWKSFNLDTMPNGTVIKPDSLFMEAVKVT
jgi:SAM-dependent methyltransferase